MCTFGVVAFLYDLLLNWDLNVWNLSISFCWHRSHKLGIGVRRNAYEWIFYYGLFCDKTFVERLIKCRPLGHGRVLKSLLPQD